MYSIFQPAVLGLFGDYLMLPVFGRNMTSVSADSPWKLSYHFAVSWEVRWVSPVSATNGSSVLCAMSL